MEIFMTHVSPLATKDRVSIVVAQILHSPSFSSSDKLNFDVFLFRNKGSGGHRSGALTLPSEDIGSKFLQLCGGLSPREPLVVAGQRVVCRKSKNSPKPGVIENIRRLPYADPRVEEERMKKDRELQAESIPIRAIQFGWECRDGVFSIEWEKMGTVKHPISLAFQGDRRELRIKILGEPTLVIAVRLSQIVWTGSLAASSDKQPSMYFSLAIPPTFESEVSVSEDANRLLLGLVTAATPSPRQRLTALDSDHQRVVSYTSHTMRLTCTRADLFTFQRLSRKAQLHTARGFDYYPIERRDCFSSFRLNQFHGWLSRLPWNVAFQVEALVQNILVDIQEILDLRPEIERVIRELGSRSAGTFLRHFSGDLRALWNSEKVDEQIYTVSECFIKSERDFKRVGKMLYPTEDFLKTPDTFDCLHATITPTTMILDGPFPEMSNRVIRKYSENQDCFLRVSFVDDNRLQYRFDREVDGPSFIGRRVGGVLKNGLRVAGREFQFLAYSQSALKEHAVIFVKPFHDKDGHLVNSTSIIQSLGSFHNLAFDSKLIYCPARYGARISQAFTATDSSISVEAEEIFPENDIGSGRWCFTDGVGTISLELAEDIWNELRSARRRAGRAKRVPRAFQIRFMGSKGMVSVDYRLSGRVICLRPSMIKFEAPESREIEIARAFDNTGKYYLNRPLIMILEGLGIPYPVFEHFQGMAVSEVQASMQSLERAAQLLDGYGLGTSYRLTSVMRSLHKLGAPPLDDAFYQQMMEFAINHALRELKHHARIPVPQGYTLVGVADIHRCLDEGEIFACVQNPDSKKITYIQGPVLISRSPTIHPGDVQVVRAIGKPPADSCFAREPLPNTVVFAVKGSRPLPSCLGGGDLDGDVYNIIPLDVLPGFTPKKLFEPASYDPAPKKLLQRHSTMADVADFVVDYINSDVLGIIAINWLIIADQSDKGIEDPDCLNLANLHSDAVDYPKSGQPVPLRRIPKLKFRAKPDWNAPEIERRSETYYESNRAIGKLFRAIDLPALRTVKRIARSQREHLQDEEDEKLSTVEELLEHFHLSGHDNDQVHDIVSRRVLPFLPQNIDDKTIEHVTELSARHASELRTICSLHTLSYSRSAMLTEEEAIMGTIADKCSQPRKRKDLMAKLREQTETLVRAIKAGLTADDNQPLEEGLLRGWAAWILSKNKGDAFGAKSFGWIALGNIFDVIKAIEDDERPFHGRI